MTYEQSALQIWSVLVLAARNQQILSYGLVHAITGVHASLQAPILGRIEHYCEVNDLPHLTAILVNQKHGVPGYLFPGYKGTPVHPEHPDHPEQSTAPNTDVYLQVFKDQTRVFAFDWLKRDAPAEEDFGLKSK
jgi:hypothetical protein